MAKVAQTLDKLASQWQAHVQRSDVTQPEREAYAHALQLVEQARKETPNKALRFVQNALIHSWDNAKFARDMLPPDSMDSWEYQAKYDAYKQLREDMAHV